MGKPKIFTDPSQSSSWESAVNSRNWGDLSNNPWKVRIDREGEKSYMKESSNSPVVRSDLHFMAEYYVAQVKDGYAQLFEADYMSGLTITREGDHAATSIGWVNVDHLLLWTNALRNSKQICRKVIVVKDLDGLKEQVNQVWEASNPEFSKSPNERIPNGNRAKELEIYFVLKKQENNGSVLLSKESEINTGQVHQAGWLKKGEYTSWNIRLCYETNFGPDVEGEVAAVFSNEDAAQTYSNSGIDAVRDQIQWRGSCTIERLAPKKPRFPVVSETASVKYPQVAQVATISTLNNGNIQARSQQDIQKDDELKEKLDDIDKALSRVNIVVVMDGTSSMKGYFKPMAKAIDNAMKSINEQLVHNTELRFGVVVYRNKEDGEKVCETMRFTNYKIASDFLLNVDPSSVGRSHYEAMFRGLHEAAEMFRGKEGQSNFVILVGDAGNDLSDKVYSANIIAEEFSHYQVNFVAVQANHNNQHAYDDFNSDVWNILSALATKRVGRQVTINDFNIDGRSTSLKDLVKTRSGVPIELFRRWADAGESVIRNRVQGIVTDKILKFRDISVKSRQHLESLLENMSPDVSGSLVESALEEFGLTPELIERSKKRKDIIKVKGYASRTSRGKDVFATSVFMTRDELDQLIKSLESLDVDVRDNERKMIQDAMKTLAKTYLGEQKAEDVNVQNLIQAVNGLTSFTGKNLFDHYTISDITEPNKFDDEQLSLLRKKIKIGLEHLKNAKNNSRNSYKSRDGNTYYYILLKDMPFMDSGEDW